MRVENDTNNKQTLQRPLGPHRKKGQMAAQWWRFPTAHAEEWLPSVSSHTAAAPRGHFFTMAEQPQPRQKCATSRSESSWVTSHCFLLICFLMGKITLHMPNFHICPPHGPAMLLGWRQGWLARSAAAATTIKWNKGGRIAVSSFLR